MCVNRCNPLSRSFQVVGNGLKGVSYRLVCVRKDNEDLAFGEVIGEVLVVRFAGKETCRHKRQVIQLGVSYGSGNSDVPRGGFVKR